MFDITVPKLNTVDTTYTLIEWLFPEGATVPAGAAVAVVETSKAAEELVCDRGGVLHHLVEPPAECALGATIGHLFADGDERSAFAAAASVADAPVANAVAGDGRAADPGSVAGDLVITKAARDLMRRHAITDEQVRSLGRAVVKAADIEQLVPSAGTAPADTTAWVPARSQRAVAEVVTRSHQTIPAAYSVMKVLVAPAQALLRHLGQRERVTLGLPELLVKCVALVRADFPLFFAEVQADGTAKPVASADVGVTMDLGTGLYIPVVRDAARSRLSTVARTLMQLRVKVLRGQLREADLIGGTITISLNDDADIVFTQPLILPSQVCMVTLGSPQEELYRDAEGRIETRSYVHLGLAYDHRLVNGRDAGLFLRALKESLERPDRLDRLDAAGVEPAGNDAAGAEPAGTDGAGGQPAGIDRAGV